MLLLFNVLEINYTAQVTQRIDSVRLATVAGQVRKKFHGLYLLLYLSLPEPQGCLLCDYLYFLIKSEK